MFVRCRSEQNGSNYFENFFDLFYPGQSRFFTRFSLTFIRRRYRAKGKKTRALSRCGKVSVLRHQLPGFFFFRRDAPAGGARYFFFISLSIPRSSIYFITALMSLLRVICCLLSVLSGYVIVFYTGIFGVGFCGGAFVALDCETWKFSQWTIFDIIVS